MITGDARDAEDFTPEEVERGRALRRGQWPPVLAGRFASLLLLLALGLTPAGAALVGLFGDAWAARIVGGGLALVLLRQLVALPFAARVRIVRTRFGLVTQGWGGWAVDVLRGLLVSVPLALGALFAVYALAGTTSRWWAWTALGAAVVTVLLSWLAPVVLEPLFNRFTPMEPGALRDALLGLAARDGIAVRDVLVADASRRTTALNAYVSGFGRTRRIVAYDTLLTTAEPAEVAQVVAHELGHVKHRDVARGTAFGALGAAAGVCLLAAVLTWRPLLDAAGVDHFSDPRSMTLLAAVAAVGSTVTGPFACALSRRTERRADAHALRLTGEPAAFIAMQRRLAVANIADPRPPRPLHVLFGTHPTTAERIAAARSWARSTGASERSSGATG
ncbi:M48 family metallopeptidase [Streptomyces sp. SPB162]|uniref:M48 family metallopeptidase n=1 Tax=Streptomyces sp. SPB162 TaxID=2940560 RepID=UPI00240656DE|nr:M48 family metallopeptidase [Streptomyces sp. SPB162]MDF9812702.1 STE24 endopeptidase [Streptomyces sp. SPB162]